MSEKHLQCSENDFPQLSLQVIKWLSCAWQTPSVFWEQEDSLVQSIVLQAIAVCSALLSIAMGK